MKAGAGGTVEKGSAACPGNGPFGLDPFGGNDEQAVNNVYQFATLGILDFADLQIIFNAQEPGSAAQQGITLENLALTLYDTAGGILDAYYISAPLVLADTDPGVGNAGFGYILDAGSVANANLLLASNPDLYIGASARASDAQGSHETISIRATNLSGDPVVPEPATFGMMALAGVAFVALRRRLS